ncbi:hypothetical protein [Flavobacterium magnum]|nr:hypothetical protein [Flavobacterium magnum]
MEQVLADMNKKNSFFDLYYLSSSNFYITTKFSECGEWGGHKEGMKIFSDVKRKQYKLDYYKLSFDCENVQNANIDTLVHKTILLNSHSQNAINKYLQELVIAKVRSKFPGHSGNYFTAASADSTFRIELYDADKRNLKSYSHLLKKLRLN